MRHLKILFATSSRALRSKSSVIARMASNSSGGDARRNILAESWSTISHEYERTLVPRFAPWTRDALDALRTALPDSDEKDSQSALVLCCGPGQELLPIARMLGPRSKVLGTDLAQGMAEAAKLHIDEECKKDTNLAYKECISVEVADAMGPPAGPYDVAFSAFGLQQLPDPVAAITEWMRVLKKGGVCAVIYWPPSPPDVGVDHPFEMWSDLVRKKLGSKTKEDPPWDEDLQAAVAAAGGELIEDRFISHDISWRDAGEMFDGMSRAGPWHALRLRRGDAFVDEIGKELQSLYPAGQPLCHKFTARMIVARCKEEQKLR